MNTLTRFSTHDTRTLSRPDPQTAVHPPELPEKLKPARGLVVGVAISVAFWAVVGIGAFLLFHH